MSKAEILRKILSDYDETVHSGATKKQRELYSEMFSTLYDTLNKEQQKLFNNFDVVESILQNNIFDDGVRYGFQLAKNLKEMLENPERAFDLYEASCTPFESMNQLEIQTLQEFKRNQDPSVEIEQSTFDFIKSYSERKGGASA